MPSIDVLLIVSAFLLGVGITGLVRIYARRAKLLDVPNQRSSHDVATPSGGGLSIVLVFLATVLLLSVWGTIERDAALTFLIGGGLVAVIGFIDDHRHVSAKWRFLVQIFAASLAARMLAGLPALQFGDAMVDLGVAGDVLLIVFMVWFTNVFNFMDGIDGIAASEAICISVGAILIAGAQGGTESLLLVILTAALLGFLAWNWPPASIFMGDVGSAFLGFVLVAIAIYASHKGVTSIWSWLILSGVFIVDATHTLLARIVARENWLSAHRSHAYQKAARRLKGHRPVTLAVVTINVLWLLPIAWFASARPEFGWWLIIVAWIPLISLALFLKAGRPEPSA